MSGPLGWFWNLLLGNGLKASLQPDLDWLVDRRGNRCGATAETVVARDDRANRVEATAGNACTTSPRPVFPRDPPSRVRRERAGAARGPRLATAFASTDESTGLLLWQVTNRWQAAQRAALKPYGLTHVQFVLLASLTWLAAMAR